MKKILNYLLEHKSLTKEMAKEVMLQIGKGVFNETEVAAFITIYLMRKIQVDELNGFREALLEMCINVHLEQQITTDIVGTGGDSKNTFNISTIAAFVTAGAGYHVIKHGNYGVTSVSGSSNVLEFLGYKFSNVQTKLQTEITATNCTFLHAPLFHPALKNVAVARKNLGLRTIFNLLGPLVNPAQPSHAVIGVYHLEIARYYNYLLQHKLLEYAIIHTLDGCDEITLTDDSKIITKHGERIMSPNELGKRTAKYSDLQAGNSVEDAAKIFVSVLKGKGTWSQNAVVFANAAIAIQNISGKDYPTSFNEAIESIESGKALQQFKKLMALQ
jgi:anthranilate phosphoribosyltransferase